MNPFAPLPAPPPAPGEVADTRLRHLDTFWFGIAVLGYPAIYAWAWRYGGSPDPDVVPATVAVGVARLVALALAARRAVVSLPLVAVAIACAWVSRSDANLALDALSVSAFVVTTALVGLAWRAEERRGRKREALMAGVCLGIGMLVPGLVAVIGHLPGAIGVQLALLLWQWWVVRRASRA